MKQSSIDRLSRVYNFLCDELRPDMAELIKEYRLKYMAEYGKGKKWHDNWTINVDGTYFKAAFIWMLLTAGVEKLYIDKNINNRVAYFETSYTKGVIMSVLND